MGRFLLRRFTFFIITLFITSIIIFGLTWLLPADPCQIKLQRDATEERLETCREDIGLTGTPVEQYSNWAWNFVQGDWGESFFTDEPVYDDVMQRLANSARLGFVVLVITVPIAVFFGVLAGLNENGVLDVSISVTTLALVSLPEFVTGIFLVETIAQNWAKDWTWLPWELRSTASAFEPEMSLYESLPFITLPALAATMVLLGYIARLTRAGVIEELKRDYVRTAELKGLPYWQVVIKHVLRNALLPTVTVIAISIGWLISGLVVIEWVFNYPGLGRFLVDAVQQNDLPRIQAISMISVSIILFANFLADLLYGILNPRIRLGDQ
jgi:peptide/nickel transport system permease protein